MLQQRHMDLRHYLSIQGQAGCSLWNYSQKGISGEMCGKDRQFKAEGRSESSGRPCCVNCVRKRKYC